jgi:hypothetical protein
MLANDLIEKYPFLYHMAEANSWPSIEKYGLMSTTALLDHYEVDKVTRFALEANHRPECVTVSTQSLGKVVIRDQKPMSDKALIKCLNGMSPSEWYKLLNSKVFFWVSKARLDRLLGARAYRKREHCVLTVKSEGIVNKYSERITLCPINSGCTVPNPQPRGRDTFKSIFDYPYEIWAKKRNGVDAIVELAVNYAVPDIAKYVTAVDSIKYGTSPKRLFP